MTDAELPELVAIHEAGHAVGLLLEGLPVKRVELNVTRDGRAGGRCVTPLSESIEATALWHLAGPAAELAAGYSWPQQAYWAGDLVAARASCARHGTDLETEFARARRAIRTQMHSVRAIAEDLLSRGRLCGDEVFLREPPAPVQLWPLGPVSAAAIAYEFAAARFQQAMAATAATIEQVRVLQ